MNKINKLFCAMLAGLLLCGGLLSCGSAGNTDDGTTTQATTPSAPNGTNGETDPDDTLGSRKYTPSMVYNDILTRDYVEITVYNGEKTVRLSKDGNVLGVSVSTSTVTEEETLVEVDSTIYDPDNNKTYHNDPTTEFYTYTVGEISVTWADILQEYGITAEYWLFSDDLYAAAKYDAEDRMYICEGTEAAMTERKLSLLDYVYYEADTYLHFDSHQFTVMESDGTYSSFGVLIHHESLLTLKFIENSAEPAQ